MTYLEAIDFLYGIRLFGQKLGLETMRQLLRLMGNPQDSLRFIHIAGTNGKGSVAAMAHAAVVILECRAHRDCGRREVTGRGLHGHVCPMNRCRPWARVGADALCRGR